MSEKRKSSAEIQKQLDAAIAEADNLRKEIEAAEANLKAMNERIIVLNGGFWNRNGGKIGYLRMQLSAAKLYEQHEKSPVVHFAGTHYDDREYIVAKVTSKRISISHRRSESLTQFNLDGSSVSSYRRQIDIRKTFGIDADSVPPNFNFMRKESNESSDER